MVLDGQNITAYEDLGSGHHHVLIEWQQSARSVARASTSSSIAAKPSAAKPGPAKHPRQQNASSWKASTRERRQFLVENGLDLDAYEADKEDFKQAVGGEVYAKAECEKKATAWVSSAPPVCAHSCDREHFTASFAGLSSTGPVRSGVSIGHKRSHKQRKSRIRS